MELSASASLAVQARERILDAILERRFEAGRLPPEDELAEMLGVSRTTVRSALQSLGQLGVLTRTPRRGTLIHDRMSPSVVALQRLIGFARLLEEKGHKVDIETSLREEVSPDLAAVEALGIAPGDACYVVQRVLAADGSPAIWAIDVFPAANLAAPLDLAGPIPNSPFEMSRHLVEPIDHALVEITPVTPTEDVVDTLGLAVGEPYILLKETHFAMGGRPLAFSLIHVNDRFVRFQLIRTDGL